MRTVFFRSVVRKMAEPRLIDANAAKKSLLSYYSFVNDNTSKSNYTGETLMSYEVADMIEDCMDNAPTIDPETLTVVRQLREELARVTAERDTAVEQLHGYCFACKHYTPYHNDGLCATCKHERACFKPWDAVDRWQWRGPQKKG